MLRCEAFRRAANIVLKWRGWMYASVQFCRYCSSREKKHVAAGGAVNEPVYSIVSVVVS